MSWTALRTAIRGKMIADSAFSTRAGSRYYINFLPKESQRIYPYVLTQNTIATPFHEMAVGESGKEIYWPIQVWATLDSGGPQTVNELADVVDVVMKSGFTLSSGVYLAGFRIYDTDVMQDEQFYERFCRTMRYKIWFAN